MVDIYLATSTLLIVVLGHGKEMSTVLTVQVNVAKREIMLLLCNRKVIQIFGQMATFNDIGVLWESVSFRSNKRKMNKF